SRRCCRRIQDLLRTDILQGDAATAWHRAVVTLQSRHTGGPRCRAAAAAARTRAVAAMSRGAVIMRAVESWICSLLLGTIAALVLVSQAGAATLKDAAENYRHYLIDDIGQALAGAGALRERLIDHDLDGARKAWIAARVGWERSEVFTSGFVPEL